MNCEKFILAPTRTLSGGVGTYIRDFLFAFSDFKAINGEGTGTKNLDGEMYRDFTYVDDLVRAIRLLIDVVPVRPSDGLVPEGDSLSPVAPYRVVNIGTSDKVRLLDFVDAIEDCLGQKATRNYMGMQAGDVPATWANANLLKTLTGYRPQTNFKDGIARFVEWYRDYSGK